MTKTFDFKTGFWGKQDPMVPKSLQLISYTLFSCLNLSVVDVSVPTLCTYQNWVLRASFPTREISERLQLVKDFFSGLFPTKYCSLSFCSGFSFWKWVMNSQRQDWRTEAVNSPSFPCSHAVRCSPGKWEMYSCGGKLIPVYHFLHTSCEH